MNDHLSWFVFYDSLDNGLQRRIGRVGGSGFPLFEASLVRRPLFVADIMCRRVGLVSASHVGVAGAQIIGFEGGEVHF